MPAPQRFPVHLEELCIAVKAGIGAQGRDRTTDTAIFSRMLYQLSYLGVVRLQQGAPVYSQARWPCPPIYRRPASSELSGRPSRIARRPAAYSSSSSSDLLTGIT